MKRQDLLPTALLLWRGKVAKVLSISHFIFICRFSPLFMPTPPQAPFQLADRALIFYARKKDAPSFTFVLSFTPQSSAKLSELKCVALPHSPGPSLEKHMRHPAVTDAAAEFPS